MQHINVELNTSLNAVDIDTDTVMPVAQADFGNFYEIIQPKVVKRPSMKEEKQKQVQAFIERGNGLGTAYEIVEQDGLKRGNKVLYNYLSNLYDFALDIFNSDIQDVILDAMRHKIKQTTGKLPSSKAPLMTIIVKYVVRYVDRQTAHNYSRALRVAFEEDVPVTELVKFIEDSGGIAKITGTKAEKKEQEINRQEVNERAELIRRLLIARGHDNALQVIDYEQAIQQWSIKTENSKKEGEKESSKDTGDFVIFLSFYDKEIKKYRIIEGNDFGAPFEMSMFRHMASRIANKNEAMKKSVQALERSILGYSLEERDLAHQQKVQAILANVANKSELPEQAKETELA